MTKRVKILIAVAVIVVVAVIAAFFVFGNDEEDIVDRKEDTEEPEPINKISVEEAEELLIEYEGTEEPETGNAYIYDHQREIFVNGEEYYFFTRRKMMYERDIFDTAFVVSLDGEEIFETVYDFYSEEYIFVRDVINNIVLRGDITWRQEIWESERTIFNNTNGLVFVKGTRVTEIDVLCSMHVRTLLPQVNLNNQHARSFNTRMENRYMNAERDEITIVSYSAFLNSNILSIVIYSQYSWCSGGGAIESINFHATEDRLMSTTEIIGMRFASINLFETALHRAIDDHFSAEVERYIENGGVVLGPVDEAEVREQFKDFAKETKERIDFNRLNVFMNERNRLSIIIHFSSYFEDHMGMLEL